MSRIVAKADDGSETDVTDAVQIVFDTAIGSMDFGSGFLDTFEVIALRRLAEALGVDPTTATPREWHSVVGETLDGKHYKVGKGLEWIGGYRTRGNDWIPDAGRVKCVCGWSCQVPFDATDRYRCDVTLSAAYLEHLALVKGSVA